ncbi:MAG TPA: hypothetical protein VK988_00330 [Acidimicrobiales bacterium]|nr:hypothetical protein [Acidimicrobiales bacterium]
MHPGEPRDYQGDNEPSRHETGRPVTGDCPGGQRPRAEAQQHFV